MLEMMWRCDACHMGNVCDVPSETHLFAAILVARSDHGSISPSCEWDATKIHGKLFHPRPTTQTLSSDAKREFHHRPGKPGESICLSCFLTVRAVKSQRLEDAEETHRRVCPHRMDIR